MQVCEVCVITTSSPGSLILSPLGASERGVRGGGGVNLKAAKALGLRFVDPLVENGVLVEIVWDYSVFEK